jgi:hypothetical protein
VEGSAVTKTELDAAKAELKADIHAVHSEVALVRSDMGRMQDRIVIRLSGVMVVLLGILFAALKLH